MKNYKGYLIDLDGTMYRGNEPIEGAAEFVNALHDKGIPYLFLTNNSSSTQGEVVKKLNNLHIHSTKEHVFTSSLATAIYIKEQQAEARCMVIGEKGLVDALEGENLQIIDDLPDFVVVGIDRDITYEKLTKASLAIRAGAIFISTNSDAAIPTERGYVPGNGAITAAITTSTGTEPVFIGKPEEIIMDEALAVLGLSKEDTLMVGDNYDTDILAGIHANIDTLMVFTGVTSVEQLKEKSKKPTYQVNNLREWITHM